MEWILLVLIGIAGSSVGSLIGMGGGIIVVPALLYLSTLTLSFSHLTPQIVVGTSLFTMIFTGLSSTLAYMKHKTIDYKSGLIFLIGSGPGSILGAWVTEKLDLDSFSIYFGVFILFVSFVLIIKNKLRPIPYKQDRGIHRTFTDNSGKTFEYGFNPIIGIVISLVVGFLSGIFGIGGGSLMVPTMILLFFFPPHVATATSMFMILPTSILSSITHIALGNVNWLYALALVPGAWIGANVGVWLNTRLKSKTIVLLIRTILIVVGVRLIYQGIIG
ncbi:sulfite exporter TauE/SafE family protein [Neobacillus muris]|uniref:sulfite exporter TauE/SafE family protein n=1 Tax=Neobacillus muris TaxID=2941334 RepID=UPI0020404788|nr:sulfite exporter TauE/SafE family protein [Neobacillus muris]